MFPSFVLTLRSVHLLPEEKACQMIHSDVRGHDGGSLHKDYKGRVAQTAGVRCLRKTQRSSIHKERLLR